MTTLNITVPIGEEGSELKLKQSNRVIGLGGLFTGQSNKSDVATVSCTHCGYTTLNATQPHNLIPDQE